MKSINPATQALIREVPDHSAKDMEVILARAAEAAKSWRLYSVVQRAELIGRVADVLRGRSEEWARMMTHEMGKPIREARAEVEKCAWVCEYYASEAQHQLKDVEVDTDASESWYGYAPLGTILGVMPWNFPFWQVFRFAIPTLAAGNTVLLKHAANVAGCAMAMEEVFLEAGFPQSVFENLFVEHDAVGAILKDPRVHGVSLTGSTRAGRAVAHAAAEALKPALLELGGSDPFIVLNDADINVAAEQAAVGRCLNAGQSCIAAKRFIVEDAVHDEFVHQFRKQMAKRVMGDPMLEETTLGPLAREDFVVTLHDQVERSVKMGAQRLAGGKLSDLGPCYYPATVLADVKPGMPVFDEETFGPVAAVVRATDLEHALELANQSIYGLGASVWTARKDVAGIAERLQCGHVAFNGIVKSDPRLPFGGVKESGYGRELGVPGIHSFVNIKTMWKK